MSNKLYFTKEERRKAHNLANIRYERKHPNRKREPQWKFRGINCTEELYQELFNKQNGCCAICLVPRSKLSKNLAVDHCHQTGKIRGLLCTYCNQIIVEIVNTKFHLITNALRYLGKVND